MSTWGDLKTSFEALGIPSSTDVHDLRAVSVDLWPRKLLELRRDGPPAPKVDVVVWPENPAQVSTLLKWSAGRAVALYPYGAGSGVCGASIAGEDEKRARMVVDLKRMRAVRTIDRISMTATVEAGIIGENLERHLNQEGLTLGHFPSSIYCSSLGGYLATRSAGQLSTKYGKIEDLVLSVEFVLPDGTVIETGRAPRSAMGPDWTQLLLGSEGTLGVFTAARLQVSKLPEERIFMGMGALDVTRAMEFARRMVQGGLRPAVLRIYDPLETQLALNSALLKEIGFESGAVIVCVFEGPARLARAEAEEAANLLRELELKDLGPKLGEHWWEHRYDVSYRQQLILSHSRMLLDTFEVAATWEKLGDVYRAVKGVSVGAGVILAHFSHFYPTGANIYFTLVSHAGFTGDMVARYDAIWRAILEAALKAGATLSHHHGVGWQKNSFLTREKGAHLHLWKNIKNAIDPENRLNPGKMGG